MRASLTLQSEGKEIEVVAGEAPPETATAWCDHARNAGFVLRRHMLLDFIYAEPRVRYDRLEPFLSLAPYLQIERGLEALALTAQTEMLGSEQVYEARQEKLRLIFELPKFAEVSAKTLRDRLNAQLSEAGIEAIKNLRELEPAEAAVKGALGEATIDARLAQLSALKGKAAKLGLASGLALLAKALLSAQSDLETKLRGHEGAILTELLERAHTVVSGQPLAICPVCEQEIDRETLLQRLSERIAADAAITLAKANVRERVAALERPVSELSVNLRSFLSEWNDAPLDPLPDQYQTTFSLLEEIAEGLRGPLTSERLGKWLDGVGSTIGSYAPAIEAIDARIVADSGGDRRTRLLTARAMLESIRADWTACFQEMMKAGAARQKSNGLNRLHTHAVEARKATVQVLLNEVSDLANEFYEGVHPGEKLANSRLAVRPTEDGSVNLQADFYGRERPPLLYFSESHLDTLGLCYFLALRRREADQFPAFKFLVLDDVVHSVDAAHRERIAALLATRFTDHQIIITMHDRFFYDRVRNAFGRNGYNYLALLGWDLDRGPTRGDAATDQDRICVAEIRETKTPEELSAAGGRFFEFILREATEALEVAIPARFKRGHDIGNMWPALASKLRRNPKFQANHPSLIEKLDANGWVRNATGAHYNEAEAAVDPAETRVFAELLAELRSALYCDDCRSFIQKHGDNDWACNCGVKDYRKQSGK